LNIVLIKTSFNIFDHQACFSYLRVTYHSYFDDNANNENKKILLYIYLFFASVCCVVDIGRGTRSTDGTGYLELVGFLARDACFSLLGNCFPCKLLFEGIPFMFAGHTVF
jgi:hypothetical protein